MKRNNKKGNILIFSLIITTLLLGLSSNLIVKFNVFLNSQQSVNLTEIAEQSFLGDHIYVLSFDSNCTDCSLTHEIETELYNTSFWTVSRLNLFITPELKTINNPSWTGTIEVVDYFKLDSDYKICYTNSPCTLLKKHSEITP